MSRYFLAMLSLLLGGILDTSIVQAAPRIIRSNTPGNEVTWLSLKKETKGQYLLLINHEGKQETEKFRLTADSTGGSKDILKFASGEEARATAALKGVEDVIIHTTANDAEATGDAAGDINSFINSVVKKGGAEGVVIVPAAPPAAAAAPSQGIPTWAYVLAALALGVGGGLLIANNKKQPAKEPIETIEEEPEIPSAASGTDINTALQAAEKLKKAQKDLKAAKAQIAQLTKAAESEAVKNTALENDYAALEARLKNANTNMATVHEQAGKVLAQLQQLQDNAARQDAYFKAAANQIVRPFTDFVSGNKINPADSVSQAIVEEQMVVMAFHYFSLVRYGAGLWDEHDIYNLQRNGGLLGAEHKAADPQSIPISVKSGYPNLVLTVAALLRKSEATGAGMDISLRGYRFVQAAG